MHLSCDLRPFARMISHPLNFLVKPKTPSPEASEALKELTLFDLARDMDASILIHDAWSRGLREVTLRGVECSIEIVEDESNSQLAEIGQKIREAQDWHRAEAREHHEKACAIGVAWSEWDVDSLVDLGAISQADAVLIRFLKENS